MNSGRSNPITSVLPCFAGVQNFWHSPKWRQGFDKSPIGHILCQFKRRSFQLQCGRICLCDQCWSEIKNCDNFVTPTWTSGRLSFCRFRYSVWLRKIQSFYGWLLALIKQICATRKSYFFCKKVYLGPNKIEVNCLCVYSRVQNSIERLFWAGNQGNHQNNQGCFHWKKTKKITMPD